MKPGNEPSDPSSTSLMECLTDSKLSAYPTRELKNREGRSIKAQLVDKNGNILTIVMDGRRFEIPISSLSDEDQAFLKNWWPE